MLFTRGRVNMELVRYEGDDWMVLPDEDYQRVGHALVARPPVFMTLKIEQLGDVVLLGPIPSNDQERMLIAFSVSYQFAMKPTEYALKVENFQLLGASRDGVLELKIDDGEVMKVSVVTLPQGEYKLTKRGDWWEVVSVSSPFEIEFGVPGIKEYEARIVTTMMCKNAYLPLLHESQDPLRYYYLIYSPGMRGDW